MDQALPYPWQQEILQELIQRVGQGTLPHGLFVSGTPGLGKAHLAKCLAEFLLCRSPNAESACGKCKPCELIRAGTHPDMKWVEPEETGKAIKIDQIRALNHFLGQTSQQGGVKVAVVTPTEAMNNNASNALLKNLEEPADRTYLILVSHAPSRVMPTIRSRCQGLPIAVPSREASSRWLTPLCADHDPLALLEMTSGAPLAARDLLDDGRLEARLSFAKDLCDIAQGQLFSIQAAGRWMDSEPLFLLESLLRWLQSCARQETQTSPLPVMEQEQQLFNELKRAKPALRFRIYDKLLKSKAQLLSGANPNKQLLLEEVAMDWQAMMNVAARPTL